MKVNSFKRKEKLTTNSDFRKTLYKGKSLKAFPLLIKYLKNNQNYSRLGISVSKRAGNAVKRNLFKRLLREWFRNNKSSFIVPLDIVILLRKKTLPADAVRFSAMINEILMREKLLK